MTSIRYFNLDEQWLGARLNFRKIKKSDRSCTLCFEAVYTVILIHAERKRSPY